MPLIIISGMAKQIKYTEKELKGPDKFVTTVVAGIEYFSDHSMKIVIGIVVIVALLVAGYIVAGHTDKKTDVASVKFNDAVDKFTAGNHAEALNEFNAVRQEYPGNDLADLAAYYAGLINYETGNYGDAVAMMDVFTGSGSDERLLIQSAVLTKGLSRFREGKWQEAIDYLVIIDEEPASPYGDQARLHMALSYENMGQPQKAKQMYDKIYGTGAQSSPAFSTLGNAPAAPAN